MSKNYNYMDSIYNMINSPEIEEDDIVYLDEPEDEYYDFGFDDGLSWADDITYLDEPEEDEFEFDLGEGYIPLPKGEYYQEELIVIDENYVLDEYEQDLIDNVKVLDDEFEEMKEMIYPEVDNETIVPDIEKAESIIKLPKEKTESEEFEIVNMSVEDDKISKAIAKEYLDNYKANNVLYLVTEEYDNPDDDVSWLDDKDLFGNDISVIIADDPNEDFEETEDYVEGSFMEWLANNQ